MSSFIEQSASNVGKEKTVRAKEEWKEVWETEGTSSAKEKGHETLPQLSNSNQALISTSRAGVFSMSADVARGEGPIKAYGDHRSIDLRTGDGIASSMTT